MLRFLSIFLILFSGYAWADSLQYTNSRFGTTAAIPVDFYAWEAPANGDGRTFQGSTSEGMIKIYGSHNPTGDDLADYRQYVTRLYRDGGSDITYQAGKKGWFVLSGWSGEDIFYLRVEGCTGGPLHHMYFEFPGTDKARWEPIIKRYAKTLDGPCG